MRGYGLAGAIAIIVLVAAPIVSAAAAREEARAKEADAAPDFRDPAVFAEVLRDIGYKAKFKPDDERPEIESRAEGLNFSVFFYGCEAQRECDVAILTASWTYDGGDKAIEALNFWNGDRYAGRAWLGESRDWIGLDRPLNLLAGYSRKGMESEIEWWASTMTDFRDYLAEEVYPDAEETVRLRRPARPI
jgi:hypothetical protein